MNIKAKLWLMLSMLLIANYVSSQGLNHHFLLGYQSGLTPYTTSKRAYAEIDSTSFTIFSQTRKMPFEACQANISDSSGNLLFATNGQWIMDATHDTMANGSGINPGACTWAWNFGLPLVSTSLILPFPNENKKYVLFHQTCNSGQAFQGMSSELYCSIVDMDSVNGLGKVVVKNQIVITDTLNAGIAACKHANGRDWWVTIFKDSTSTVHTILVDPTGIKQVYTQNLPTPPHGQYNAQPKFSPDGKKFSYMWITGVQGNVTHTIRLFDFNRCTGAFSNAQLLTFKSSFGGLGLSFSPSSQFLYACSYDTLYQYDTDAANVQASRVTVAVNDGYCWPYNFTCTDFWTMYLAANGWIYISSGNGVLQNHYIEFPDSAGIACNVHLHTIQLPCWSYRGNVNHPNYYLGCDTTLGCGCATSFQQEPVHDFKFRVYPNPLLVSKQSLQLGYLLPQNKHGTFKLLDYTGKVHYQKYLPPWSNEQSISLPLLSSGMYFAVIESGGFTKAAKVLIQNE